MWRDPDPQIPRAQHGRKRRQTLWPGFLGQSQTDGPGGQIVQQVGLQNKDKTSIRRPVKIELTRHQNLRNCESGTPFSSIHRL